jgi:hypothetical protein
MDESSMPPMQPTPAEQPIARARSSIDLRLVWGLGLVVLGALLLLQNMGFLGGTRTLWAALLAAGGVSFLVGLAQDRSHWWLAIPGFTLLGLGLTIALGELAPGVGGWLGGTVFLASIGLSFIVVFILRPDYWWALIPAGTLATLAVVAGLSGRVAGLDSGALLFLGLAATFLVLALLPQGRGRQTWAVFPAAVLGIMGLLMGAAFGTTARVFWPIALILVGLLFILRTGRGRRLP